MSLQSVRFKAEWIVNRCEVTSLCVALFPTLMIHYTWTIIMTLTVFLWFLAIGCWANDFKRITSMSETAMNLHADIVPWRAKRSEGISMLMIGDSLNRYTIEDLEYLASREGWPGFQNIHYDRHRVVARLQNLEAVSSNRFLALTLNQQVRESARYT